MNEREGDLRVPLISFMLCICVLIGGIFLFLYLFVPNLSQPWFPAIALILIGFPWLLWLFTYMYTCIKRCCGFSSTDNRQISRRASRAPTMANSGMARNVSLANSQHNNNSDGKNVQFGAASINFSHGSKDGGASISSSQEIEMPLTSSAPSWWNVYRVFSCSGNFDL